MLIWFLTLYIPSKYKIPYKSIIIYLVYLVSKALNSNLDKVYNIIYITYTYVYVYVYVTSKATIRSK